MNLLLSFLKALPNGKTRYPMELVVDKMGTSVVLTMQLKLKNQPLDLSITEEYKQSSIEIRM